MARNKNINMLVFQIREFDHYLNDLMVQKVEIQSLGNIHIMHESVMGTKLPPLPFKWEVSVT